VLSAVMNLAACFGASQRALWTFLQGADRTRARRSMATGHRRSTCACCDNSRSHHWKI